MSRVGRGVLFALFAAAMLAQPSAARAEPVRCVADCNGDGAVLINELVAAVSIALGAPLDGCRGADANGDAQVSIDELVRAVGDALNGCGFVSPTPTPTATSLPTTTPSSSPSPTVGIDVSGLWRTDRAALQSSTCVKALADAVRASIRNGNFNCDYRVEQHGATADVTETCKGQPEVFPADVAPDGTLTHRSEASDSTDGCEFTVTTLVAAPLAQSPTTISGTYDFAFAPACGLANCRLVVTGRMRRID